MQNQDDKLNTALLTVLSKLGLEKTAGKFGVTNRTIRYWTTTGCPQTRAEKLFALAASLENAPVVETNLKLPKPRKPSKKAAQGVKVPKAKAAKPLPIPERSLFDLVPVTSPVEAKFVLSVQVGDKELTLKGTARDLNHLLGSKLSQFFGL